MQFPIQFNSQRWIGFWKMVATLPTMWCYSIGWMDRMFVNNWQWFRQIGLNTLGGMHQTSLWMWISLGSLRNTLLFLYFGYEFKARMPQNMVVIYNAHRGKPFDRSIFGIHWIRTGAGCVGLIVAENSSKVDNVYIYMSSVLKVNCWSWDTSESESLSTPETMNGNASSFTSHR